MKKIIIISLSLFALAVLIIIYRKYEEKKRQETISYLNREIDVLIIPLGAYPPQFKDDKEKKITEKKLHDAINTGKQLLLKFPYAHNAQVKWQIGELYRFDHNLDTEGAWQNSKYYLEKSIKEDPKFVKAYLSLGSLYVNSDIALAAQAEKLFLQAKTIAKGKDYLAALNGLFFAYYYQLKLEKSLAMAEEALKIDPNNQTFLTLKTVVLKVLNR